MATNDYPPVKTRLVITLVDEQGEEHIDSPMDTVSIIDTMTTGLKDFIGFKDVDGSTTLIKVDRILVMRLIPQEG